MGGAPQQFPYPFHSFVGDDDDYTDSYGSYSRSANSEMQYNDQMVFGNAQFMAGRGQGI